MSGPRDEVELEAQAAHTEDPAAAEGSARPGAAPVAPTAGEAAERAARKWYIVHTYSGFEERVKETLRQRAEALDMGNAFGEIRIPTETVVEYKGGKKRETQRKFFPGYILVEMEMSDAAWHVVKNTPKVTGFVGTGRKPTPLSQDEVDKILEQVVTAKEKPKPKYVFERAEPVRITDGPFNNFTGVVDDVNLDRNTLKVMVTIFGRQTPVELDFSQVQKI
jgi:transcription termination/antitermination protein NusG